MFGAGVGEIELKPLCQLQAVRNGRRNGRSSWRVGYEFDQGVAYQLSQGSVAPREEACIGPHEAAFQAHYRHAGK